MGRRDITVADVVRRAITHSYERLIAHEDDLRAGEDPEAVHQARVATRRLRSDLRTFEDFVDAGWAADLRGELRWLGSELGAVRDLEVQRDRLRAHAAGLPATEAVAAERVVRRLDDDHEAARADLLAMLHHPRYEQLRAQLANASEQPAFTEAASRPAAEALAPVVRGRWKKLRNTVDRLGDNPPDEALHATRVRAKQCRYAAEACEPAFGKSARRLADALGEVQDILGEHHDAIVAGAWLAKTAYECSPTEAYAIGMLARLEREAADAARAAFPSAWRHARSVRERGGL